MRGVGLLVTSGRVERDDADTMGGKDPEADEEEEEDDDDDDAGGVDIGGGVEAAGSDVAGEDDAAGVELMGTADVTDDSALHSFGGILRLGQN